jgi:hypothetical protein
MRALWRTVRSIRSDAALRPGAHGHERDDQGAVLILALIFLVAVSLIVMALLSWVGTSLTATGAFANERSLESAVTSAMNLAIDSSRYPSVTPTNQQWATLWTQQENASPPVACFPGGTIPTIDNEPVEVFCSMQWQPFTAETRTITYSACDEVNGTLPTAPACADAPTLLAIVVYDDYPTGVTTPYPNPTPCYDTDFCGQSMTQVSWEWNPTVPTVTSFSTGGTPNTSSPITGGVPVTVNGSGFVNGATVSLVQETGNTPTNSGQSATQPTQGVVGPFATTFGGCAGPASTDCTLTLTSGSPAVTSGTDYFIVVTTPGGSSAYVPTSGGVNSDDLQYTTTTPQVTGISGLSESGDGCGSCPGGPITGGNQVTVTGSGFYSDGTIFPLIVLFCSASPCSASGSSPTGTPGVVLSATSTSATVVSPAVSTPGVYFIQVDTIGGQSTGSSVQYGYVVQAPIIVSIAPTTPPAVGHGTSVTLTGDNFVPGSTVTWYVDNNGTTSGSGTASGTTTVNATGTVITTVLPTLPNDNTSYFPVVTLPSADGSLQSQPYNESSDILEYSS